jgi:hypothetical protein
MIETLKKMDLVTIVSVFEKLLLPSLPAPKDIVRLINRLRVYIFIYKIN